MRTGVDARFLLYLQGFQCKKFAMETLGSSTPFVSTILSLMIRNTTTTSVRVRRRKRRRR